MNFTEVYQKNSITLLLPKRLEKYAGAIGRILNDRYEGIFHEPRVRAKLPVSDNGPEPVILIGRVKRSFGTASAQAEFHEAFRAEARRAIRDIHEELERALASLPVHKHDTKKKLLQYAESIGATVNGDAWECIQSLTLRRYKNA